MRTPAVCPQCSGEMARKDSKSCWSCYKKNNSRTKPRKDYARNWHLQKKYGLTSEDFDVYWIAGKGRCFICEKKLEMPKSGQGQGLDVVAVDHDHKSGRIRGLLCNACNKGLGFFNDDIELLKKATKYMEMNHG
jgi:hypothetical protein